MAAMNKRSASTTGELYAKLLDADDPDAAGELNALRLLMRFVDATAKR